MNGNWKNKKLNGNTKPAGRRFFTQIRLSEVHRKTGAELVCNGIVGRNLGKKQKALSQIQPHNAIVDEFRTSLLLNLGKFERRIGVSTAANRFSRVLI